MIPNVFIKKTIKPPVLTISVHECKMLLKCKMLKPFGYSFMPTCDTGRNSRTI